MRGRSKLIIHLLVSGLQICPKGSASRKHHFELVRLDIAIYTGVIIVESLTTYSH